MTLLKDIGLKRAYSSDADQIITEFLVPVLAASREYKRLAGFFSSTTLAVAARGISGLIRNDGHMQLVVSPRLNREDLEVITNNQGREFSLIEEKMLKDLDNIEEEFVRDHLSALGWMVATARLEIKVAITYDHQGRPISDEEIEETGLFHQKVGILRDPDNNMISFSGSVNETAMGWLGNIEEFKVFRSWEPSELEYLEADTLKFERFWQNLSERTKVIPVPQAIKEKLIRIAPQNINHLELEKWYRRTRKRKPLFPHQKDAVQRWSENNMQGIFEMATGTGKTVAALGCLDKALANPGRLLAVISCPYQHLTQQWLREIDDFEIEWDHRLFHLTHVNL